MDYSFTIEDQFPLLPYLLEPKEAYLENLPVTFISHLGPQSPEQHPLWETKCVIF